MHKAEATLRVRGETIHALASEGDMYAAIDALADKLERRVRKHKEKLTDHHAAGSAEKRAPVARRRAAPLALRRRCAAVRLCAPDIPQRAVGLGQERGAAHARGSGLLLHRQHSGGAAAEPSSPTPCAAARVSISAPPSASTRAIPTPRSPPCRRCSMSSSAAASSANWCSWSRATRSCCAASLKRAASIP